jgi:hypothetical protein
MQAAHNSNTVSRTCRLYIRHVQLGCCSFHIWDLLGHCNRSVPAAATAAATTTTISTAPETCRSRAARAAGAAGAHFNVQPCHTTIATATQQQILIHTLRTTAVPCSSWCASTAFHLHLHLQGQPHPAAQLRFQSGKHSMSQRLCLTPITHLRRRRCWLLPAGPVLVAPPGWLPA